MASIDSKLFIEIILSEENIRTLKVDASDGESFIYVSGRDGHKVIICDSDEYISKMTAENYLEKLGLSYLIPLMCYD